MLKNKSFFIGIDLGWKEKKTTGVCIRIEDNFLKCADIFGKDVLRFISPYLKNTEVIAVDAPLTKGRGKGKMRLYEKFLSTSIFRQAKVNPVPPALMPKLCETAQEIVKKLDKKRFALGINLIETFPTLVRKICWESFFLKYPFCQTENQKSASICARVAFLHSQFKTRYLGYRDGFLFLPEMSFWKKEWKKKFYQAWEIRPRLKYYRLITNIFTPPR